MTTLHYGSQVTIRLDPASARRAAEGIAAHATRGGWVTVSDTAGREWSLLVTAGIPMWLEADD